ncbi:MAG TPA: crotonase/enoyl-CoA hydratase family protein [Kofleriaceae bacterium]|jgi:enoyl-CoA hydratase
MTDALARYELADSIATITMDDGKANALSPTMIEQLQAALDRARTDNAGAVVLAGRPDKFCAGFDLRIMMSGPDNAIALLRQGADLLMRLYELPVPLVIACTGHALAGGSLVVLTGDTRLCADGAYKIGLNEVAIGMPIPVLAMELARARLSPQELTRATLLANIYAPTDARAAGWFDAVLPAADVAAAAKVEAVRLAALSKPAFLATKARLRSATVNLIRTTFDEDVKSAMQR